MADKDKQAQNEAVLLLEEITKLREEAKAIEAAAEVYEDRLRLLMNKTRERSVRTDYAKAEFRSKRTFEVIDPTSLQQLFPYEVVAKHFKPPAKFVDAAKGEGIKVDSAIREGVSESMSVVLSRSKDAMERRSKMAEQSRREADEAIKKIREQLRGAISNGKRKPSRRKSG